VGEPQVDGFGANQVRDSMDRRRSGMERFVQKYRSIGVTLHESDGGHWLDICEPAVLASFVAFCKTSRGSGGRPVYLRGQDQHYPRMVSSLFRSARGPDAIAKRWAAYQHFVQGLPGQVKGTRFTRRDFGAVLQHYGFRTPWLDVVDDLHAAIWFALHKCEWVGQECVYRPTSSDSGWIVLIAKSHEGCALNLREEHSSRNARCHAQQGFSLAMQHDDAPAPCADQDFAADIIGTVRIPNSDRWRLRGFRASQEYFFPSPDLDSTYRRLLAATVDGLAEQAERQHGLRRGILGRVVRYPNSNASVQPFDDTGLKPKAANAITSRRRARS
jgi:hypothetical protein